MAGYIPATAEQQAEMLRAIGVGSMEELFSDVPEGMLCGPLALPEGQSELSVRRQIEAMAEKNVRFKTIFRGAGAYRHYIPSIVKQVAAKETFVTAYTPYQAEISQGVLQAIFEYQSEICLLTGLDVSNASVYDGATAAAEAVIMCVERKRKKALVAANAPKDTLDVIGTYCAGAEIELQQVPWEGGSLDMNALEEMLDEETACLYVASPNYYGQFEDVGRLAELCHAVGARLIVGCNPISLAILKPPSECDVDIAVGDGQPLGLPLSYGGPYLGFMACKKELMRKLPGRIVGQTTDADGRRCFVLTLQAREQHIRREKASSSICSNQALCALTATAYFAAMGPGGLQQAALQCYSKAHYLEGKLAEIGFVRPWKGECFNEFLTSCPTDAEALLARLAEEGILGGLATPHGILWCCTELNTKEEIDRLTEICREVAAG